MKRLSVIIPTYKGEDSLLIALESLVRQSYGDIEVIVSDDNGKGTKSQLETQKVIDSYREKLKLIYLINEHVNGSHARNQGLKESSGDYISFLDDDDFYLSDYAEKAVEAFENPNVDMVFFNVAVLTQEGVSRIVANRNIEAIDLLFYRKEIGTGSNLCFRRKLYEEDGGFDERYLRSQDIEFAVKKIAKYTSVWVNELEIVKYYNKTDNFPDYRKSLDTYKLLREDLLGRGIIDDVTEKQLHIRQLHSLYNDMLAKQAKKEDVKTIYKELEKLGSLSLRDRAMFSVYSISRRLFTVAFNVYLSFNNNKTSTKELLEYRNRLADRKK